MRKCLWWAFFGLQRERIWIYFILHFFCLFWLQQHTNMHNKYQHHPNFEQAILSSKHWIYWEDIFASEVANQRAWIGLEESNMLQINQTAENSIIWKDSRKMHPWKKVGYIIHHYHPGGCPPALAFGSVIKLSDWWKYANQKTSAHHLTPRTRKQIQKHMKYTFKRKS